MVKQGRRYQNRAATTMQPPALALAKRILELFLQELHLRGVVPIPDVMKLIFLTLVARFLRRPVCLVVKGPSSAGKSFAIDSVLEFFPPSAYLTLTAMSERALAYSNEPFVHRVIVIYESAGLSGEMSLYLIRSLISEGRIDYHTVVKTKNGLEGQRIIKDGPTGLIVSTTRVRLHRENETRMFSVGISDSTQQTAAIMEAQAAGSRPKRGISEWHKLDNFLASGSHDVDIPYAGALAKLVPPASVRLRRDFPAVLSLIRAHAILHQATRERDHLGRVVANLDDYRQVRRLVERLISEGIGRTVSKSIRRTVMAVPKGLDRRFGEGVTVKHVADELEIDEPAASRRVGVAIREGYLENLQSRKYAPAKLVRGASLPGKFRVLPTTRQLAAAFNDAHHRRNKKTR